ncbi:YncE family protein [Undibacterium sp. RuTC16W]|uniref:YncE family protein n=1 Tax=Undibacterium sp. RuTC16W TaxID=3413048 RepID=UPI003BF19C5B
MNLTIITSSSMATLLLGTLFVSPFVSASESGYNLAQQWSLGKISKWDYLDIDPVRQRLFLTKSDHVQILDVNSGKQIGEIPNTLGVHGVAFAENLKIGFTSNGKSNSVTVFDLDSLVVKQEIKISGLNPDALLYETASQKLFVFNGKSADVTVIDAKTLKVISTIATTGRPEFSVSNQAGKIYFNVEDKNEVHVIDVATNKLISKWHLDGCEEPTGLAIDINGERLFSVCQNKKMIVTDAKTGKKVAAVDIGEHPDAVIYDQETSTIFSSNGDAGGSLSVIHQRDVNNYDLVENIKTAQGAKTMAMDMKSKKIYLPAILNNTFTIMTFAKK